MRGVEGTARAAASLVRAVAPSAALTEATLTRCRARLAPSCRAQLPPAPW